MRFAFVKWHYFPSKKFYEHIFWRSFSIFVAGIILNAFLFIRQAWDWSDFKNSKNLPYILSGGLNVTNIKKAISLTGADFVDINSGVEEQPGEKSLTLIDGIISSIYN